MVLETIMGILTGIWALGLDMVWLMVIILDSEAILITEIMDMVLEIHIMATETDQITLLTADPEEIRIIIEATITEEVPIPEAFEI